MERPRAYEAMAEVYREMGWCYWTPEAVAEAERRMTIDDADRPVSTVVAADFALRVLDKLGVVDPFDGPASNNSETYRSSTVRYLARLPPAHGVAVFRRIGREAGAIAAPRACAVEA